MKSFMDLLPRGAGGAASAGAAPARTSATKVSVPMSSDGSVSVRKIDNGFVTRSSEWKGGQYHEREVFSFNPPTIEVKS